MRYLCIMIAWCGHGWLMAITNPRRECRGRWPLALGGGGGRRPAALFSPEGSYLDSPTYGLPPRTGLGGAADSPRTSGGTGGSGFNGWGLSVGDGARRLCAQLHERPRGVAVGSAGRPLRGRCSPTSLPAGARVVGPAGGLHLLLFPFLAQETRGVTTELVPLDRSGRGASTAHHDPGRFQRRPVGVVGRVADLDAIASAPLAHHGGAHGTSTRAAGVRLAPAQLPTAMNEARVTPAVKWLLNPRGTAFMAIRRSSRRRIPRRTPRAGTPASSPVAALLRGSASPGPRPPSRFSLVPAWLSWVGAAPALHPARSRSASRLSTRTTSGSRTGCATGSGSPPRVRRSSPSDRPRRPRPPGGRRRARLRPRRPPAPLAAPLHHRGRHRSGSDALAGVESGRNTRIGEGCSAVAGLPPGLRSVRGEKVAAPATGFSPDHGRPATRAIDPTPHSPALDVRRPPAPASPRAPRGGARARRGGRGAMAGSSPVRSRSTQTRGGRARAPACMSWNQEYAHVHPAVSRTARCSRKRSKWPCAGL